MNPRGEAAIRLADAIEAAAYRDMYAAAPAALDSRSEVVAGATLLLAPRIPVPFFNRVIGLGVDRPVTESDVDAVMDVYRNVGVAGYWLHLSPIAKPALLPDWLRERGFEPPPRRSWAKFLREPEAPPNPSTGLHIRLATGADAATMARTVCTAFGMPPLLAPWFETIVDRPGWRVCVAEADGRIVAAGSVYLHDRTAWLGIGATLAQYRRRGAQGALLAERIRLATAADCTVLATETGESIASEPNPSLNNIRRYGFTQICSRLNLAARV